jgi:hypothetical protein
MFDCAPLRARLTVSACARMWASALQRPPQPGEARLACVGCEVGARHAGRDVEDARRQQRIRDLADICVSCETAGRRLVGNTLCVSCYNRAREARLGRDARGRQPGFQHRYYTAALVVAAPRRTEARLFRDVLSLADAARRAAKASQGEIIHLAPSRLSAIPHGAMLDLGPAFVPHRYRRRQRRAAACPVPPVRPAPVRDAQMVLGLV